MNKCLTPPQGWECTRESGHEGPCAAKKTSVASGDTPETSKVSKEIGKLAAKWRFGDISASEFAILAQAQLDDLGIIERTRDLYAGQIAGLEEEVEIRTLECVALNAQINTMREAIQHMLDRSAIWLGTPEDVEAQQKMQNAIENHCENSRRQFEALPEEIKANIRSKLT